MKAPALAAWTSGLAGPATDAWLIHYDATARARRGEDVIILSVGDPDFTTPARIREAAKTALDAGHTHYADVQGKPADIGGYYMPDAEKLSAIMRPSKTLNAALDSVQG